MELLETDLKFIFRVCGKKAWEKAVPYEFLPQNQNGSFISPLKVSHRDKTVRTLKKISMILHNY